MDKLRLLMTNACHNNCDMCCNKQLNVDSIPVVEHFNYDEIIITGGEPLLFPDRLRIFVSSIRRVQLEAYGKSTKIFLYTARAGNLYNLYACFDGITVTPHTEFDVAEFIGFNKQLLRFLDEENGPIRERRLYLFPEMEKFFEDIDLSLWNVKHITWKEDCPLPEGEELRRIYKPWTKDV